VHKALTVVFVKPDEDTFHIYAGTQGGLQGLIFNFPQVKQRAMEIKTPSTAAGSNKWQCVLWGFAYDEALGIPEEGMPAGSHLIDNRGSGTPPVELVAKPTPDGYTLFVGGVIYTLGHLLQETSYDPVRDFEPISMVAIAPQVLIVHPTHR
jgi:hypothetical protein